MSYDERTKLEALRDQMDTYGKGANYLLLGHSAGFAGCLSIVKEHPDLPPPFQHIDVLILLFGIGLILGASFWFFSMILKISVTQSIISQTSPSSNGKFKTWMLQGVLHVSLWGSMGLFVGAMLLIMYPFRDGLSKAGRWVTAPR